MWVGRRTDRGTTVNHALPATRFLVRKGHRVVSAYNTNIEREEKRKNENTILSDRIKEKGTWMGGSTYLETEVFHALPGLQLAVRNGHTGSS